MESLINLFNRYVSLNPDEVGFLKENVRSMEVTRNQVLLQEGEISREFYFIVKGCLRLYYLSNFEEKTAFFYTEHMFASSYQSFTKQIPATHNLAAIEDAELIVFDLESVVKFTTYSPKFELLARVMMEEELSIYQEIISSFITQNAEERYLKLLKEKPDLIQRIPQHQIATFLGVTPETLSRIRTRILKK